ncbi:hypothetical protein J4Q44_G00391850 [Coregonus suidteri]|uniref:Uncharacterized protein n=1 Tax=Coregonus suidteri TaxID=861788 RepID=A0AAN8KDL6_9TELE
MCWTSRHLQYLLPLLIFSTGATAVCVLTVFLLCLPPDAERSHRGQPDRPNARLARCGQPPSHPHTPPSSVPPVAAPRAGATGAAASPAPTPGPDPRPYPPAPQLCPTQLAGLDVGGDSVSGTLSSLSGHNLGDDFDMFAQTRNQLSGRPTQKCEVRGPSGPGRACLGSGCQTTEHHWRAEGDRG